MKNHPHPFIARERWPFPVVVFVIALLAIVVQLIARRILCYVKAGHLLTHSRRYGFIHFGWRADVYLPEAHVKVSIGDHYLGSVAAKLIV